MTEAEFEEWCPFLRLCNMFSVTLSVWIAKFQKYSTLKHLHSQSLYIQKFELSAILDVLLWFCFSHQSQEGSGWNTRFIDYYFVVDDDDDDEILSSVILYVWFIFASLCNIEKLAQWCISIILHPVSLISQNFVIQSWAHGLLPLLRRLRRVPHWLNKIDRSQSTTSDQTGAILPWDVSWYGFETSGTHYIWTGGSRVNLPTNWGIWSELITFGREVHFSPYCATRVGPPRFASGMDQVGPCEFGATAAIQRGDTAINYTCRIGYTRHYVGTKAHPCRTVRWRRCRSRRRVPMNFTVGYHVCINDQCVRQRRGVGGGGGEEKREYRLIQRK